MSIERVVVWFSCGATSAIAAKLAVDRYRRAGLPLLVLYCETRSEHEDNQRFLRACEHWFDMHILSVSTGRYRDTWDVWERERYIAGVAGAKCTTELKKRVRQEMEEVGDLHVFGYDSDEADRASAFRRNNPEVSAWFPLLDAGLDKAHCLRALDAAGIARPTMYLLGYRNNNCIGCPKGGAGYWNKIRRDFPNVFERMAALEERLGARLIKLSSGRVSLRELPPNVGRYESEPSLSCGVLCAPTQAAP